MYVEFAPLCSRATARSDGLSPASGHGRQNVSWASRILLFGVQRAHSLPFARLRRFQHSVGDQIGRQPVAERGLGGRTAPERFEKVGELVGERVLVADLQAGHPPPLHVRMIAVGDVDALPAAQLAFIAVIEKLQPVQIVQIPERRGMFAIDFERVQRLVSARIPRRLERGERSVREAAQERAGVVDADRLDAPAQSCACAL